MKSGRAWIVWTVGLAMLSALMLLLAAMGKPNFDVFPTSLSADPGGAVGLYRALESSGLKTRRLYSPPAAKDKSYHTVVVFTSSSDGSVFGRTDYEYQYNHRLDYQNELKNAKVFVIIEAPFELPLAQQPATSVTTDLSALKRVKRVAPAPISAVPHDEAVLVRTAEGRPVVSYHNDRGRQYYTVHGGVIWLNRFIRQADNAKLAVALISAVTPRDAAVAFPEYLYGVRRSENLFTKLGPAYSASLIQLLLMFVLLIVALGKRFGYPEADVQIKPGSARFFRALGDTFRRRQCTDVVLDASVDRALRTACRKFAIRADIPRQERLSRVPRQLGRTLREAALLAPTRPSPRHTAALISEIETLLKEISS